MGIQAQTQRAWVAIAEALGAVMLISLVPIWVTAVSVGPVVIGIIRLSIAVLGVGLWFLLFSRLPKISMKHWFGLVLVGFFFAAHWVTYFFAIKLSTPSIGAIGLSSYGVHLTVLSWLCLSQRPGWIAVLAVVLAVVGNVLVVAKLESGSAVLTGFLVGVLSGFFYAVVPLLHKRIALVPAGVRTLAQFSFALLFFLPLAPWVNWQIQAGDWLYLLLMGVVCTLIGHALWVRASTLLDTRLTSCIFYLGMPCTVVFEQIFMPVALQMTTVLGIVLIVLANMMSLWNNNSRMNGAGKNKV